jgi:hypothetical protein
MMFQICLKMINHSTGGKHRDFFALPEFVAAESLDRSLPFCFVEGMKVGKTKKIPSKYLSRTNKNAKQAESEVIRSVQLWRDAVELLNGEISHHRIYLF